MPTEVGTQVDVVSQQDSCSGRDVDMHQVPCSEGQEQSSASLVFNDVIALVGDSSIHIEGEAQVPVALQDNTELVDSIIGDCVFACSEKK